MKLTPRQKQFLNLYYSGEMEDEVYSYLSLEGKEVFLYKRLGSADIHLTNICRSLARKGLVSYNHGDKILINFKSPNREPVLAFKCLFNRGEAQ